MSQLVVKNLYIFSVTEKRARLFTFSAGTNIITSRKVDGNKVGKSILLKSIYYTLGADCFFDNRWAVTDKIYIIDILVNDIAYTIYRADKLFKIFKDDNILHVTTNRHELGNYFGKIFNFYVQLPNRSKDVLEITPPAYFFLLNFLDQDKMQGTTFASFDNLGQYNDYKENLLYSHFGVFNDNYYILKKQEEIFKNKIDDITKNINMLSSFIQKIKDDIITIDYTSNLDMLNKEIDLYKDEYVKIITNLSKLKEKMISYRNQKEDLRQEIEQLSTSKLLILDNVKKVNDEHLCPVCQSNLDENPTISNTIRAKEYNSLEDLILLTNACEQNLHKIDYKLNKEKEKYSQQLEILQNYQNKLSVNKNEVENIVTQQGVIEIREKFTNELGQLQTTFSESENKLKSIKKELKIYNEKRKDINENYYKLMNNDKLNFNLKEILDINLKNIKSTYKAQGSNRGIATVIWIYNLLKLKTQFNPTAIKFPIVLDSPTDVELDDDKENLFFEYIFKKFDTGTQLIVSVLGFDINNHKDLPIDNIIHITTPKYNLLTEADYEKYKSVLVKLNNSSL